MNTNKLPEYFAIKWSDNPLWNKYITWLNETYENNLSGNAFSYYGYDGFSDNWFYNINNFKNPVTELTLEQWDNIVNKKNEFVLPEKWIVKVTEENKTVLDGWKQKINPYSDPAGLFNQYLNYKGYNDFLKSEYTEITFEQFKKYVLKQDNMNKEIIGYKLVKPEYKEAILQIMKACNWSNYPMLDSYESSGSILKLKEAGVLDLWFEPVYKEEKTLPKIGSFEGTYQNNIVTYGCQSFTSEFIKTIANADSIDSMSIKGTIVTKQQIKQIYEYIKSKD
jgi:hypothetical protein